MRGEFEVRDIWSKANNLTSYLREMKKKEEEQKEEEEGKGEGGRGKGKRRGEKEENT